VARRGAVVGSVAGAVHGSRSEPQPHAGGCECVDVRCHAAPQPVKATTVTSQKSTDSCSCSVTTK